MISLRYHNDIICKSISPRYLFNIIIISIRYCLKIQGFCKVDKNVSPNVQTRTLSPMEEDNEVNKIAETEKFIYEPSIALGTSPSSPSSQEGNTQRLDNFEAKINKAFNMLTNMTGKFDLYMNNNQTPYINEDRAREFNNGTTNTQHNQK
ncbi:unnamed protein product [Rhizophagus irregularis]|nr:unnamed protein product [Rhizophagus irregularis]